MGKIGEVEINLAGTVPPESRCGLATVFDALSDLRSTTMHIGVVMFDAQIVKIDKDSGVAAPTVRIKRWEVATGPDAALLVEMIDRINSERTGEDQQSLATTAERAGQLGGGDLGGGDG